MWRRDARALLQLAVPLALTQLAEVAMRTTDVLMIGWLGTEALAAASLGMSIHMLAVLFGTGLASATAPLVAQALGARQPRAVRRSIRQGLWVAILVTTPVALLTCAMQTPLLALGQDPELVPRAHGYLAAAAPAIVFTAIAIAIRGFMTSFGHARAILLVTLAAVVANAGCNALLIFGLFGLPRLELVGAGISTTAVSFLSVLALAWIAARRAPYRRYRIFARWWRPDWARFRQVLRIGMPIGSIILLEVGLFSAAALLMGVIGTVALAAHQIVIQLASITFMVPLGIGQAATIRVALAAGADDHAAIRRIALLARSMATLVMALAGTAFLLLPDLLIRPFLADPASQSALIATATSLLAVAAAFQIADGLQVVGASLLRGLQDTLIPMWLGAVGYWLLGFPVAAGLGLGTSLAAAGVWIGLAIGLTSAAILLHWRFRRLTAVPPQRPDDADSVPFSVASASSDSARARLQSAS